MLNKIKNWIDFPTDKEKIKLAFIYTYLIGFIAHGFSFLNLQMSHDSISEFALAYGWKIRIGRYFKPIYDTFLGIFISLPWMNGLTILAWLSLASYLVIKIFNIQKKSHMAIICGLLCVNITIISLNATFLNDASGDAFGIFITILGVYYWQRIFDLKTKKEKMISFLKVVFCLWLSLGIYQAFICIFISLVLIISIIKLIDIHQTYSWKEVWINDIIGALECLTGGIVYYCGLKAILAVTHFKLIEGNYNSITNVFAEGGESIASKLTSTINQYLDYFIRAKGYNVYPDIVVRIVIILLLVIALYSFVCIIRYLKKNGISWMNIISAIFFILLLPIAMNLIRLLNTTVHDLMIYAFWFTYILILLFVLEYIEIKPSKIIERITLFLLSCVLVINIQIANACYAKKSFDEEATLSVMTRVVERIETLEGYEPGVTPVMFIGTPTDYLKEFYEFEGLHYINGTTNAVVTYQEVYFNYVAMIMKVDMNIVKKEYAYENLLNEKDVENIKAFPDTDSIRIVDGVVVVNFE